ncbi:unnamed protein product [Cyclocybe aegerita]|uniref:Uncharacterized protein n=1 Tax=Cyclocybe aegerita TaxID=1973307 RepID=A0A8S0XNB2_CYCAE|nr:unnamed protein product [Cyclocybe aegerita]
MLAPLSTEMALQPLRFWRAFIALNFLKYLTGLHEDRLARCALVDSMTLALDNRASWYGDLQTVLTRLNAPMEAPDAWAYLPQDVEKAVATLNTAMLAELQGAINNSPKLYLLHGLRERGDGLKVLDFRHYLHVPNAAHRRAITQILLSSHSLALERLRWTEHRRPRIPREDRKCRICKEAIESPEHALLECQADENLTTLRNTFIAKFYQECPTVVRPGQGSSAHLLQAMIHEEISIKLVAKFTFEVLSIFEGLPIEGLLPGDSCIVRAVLNAMRLDRYKGTGPGTVHSKACPCTDNPGKPVFSEWTMPVYYYYYYYYETILYDFMIRL